MTALFITINSTFNINLVASAELPKNCSSASIMPIINKVVIIIAIIIKQSAISIIIMIKNSNFYYCLIITTIN